MADFDAIFTLEEPQPINATFSINMTPTKLSELQNDADYVQDADYVHTDNNFTNANKVNLDNQSGINTGDQDVPTALSELTDDSTHRLVTDTEKNTWNSKQNAGDYATNTELANKVDKVTGKSLSTNDLTNILKSNYDTAYADAHTHSNKSTLDNTTASFTTAQATNLNNQSGTNTGDETNSTIKTKLGISTLSGINTGDETQSSIISKIGYNPSNALTTPTVSSGNGAPISTPAKIGDVYVDTTLSTHPVFYSANGTTSSANWIKQNGCYVLSATTSTNLNSPVDATAYFFGALQGTTNLFQTTGDFCKIIVPSSGIIRKCTGVIETGGATGSSEVSSLYIRVNDTTDYLVSNSIVNNIRVSSYNNQNLNIPINSGDFITIKWVTPVWVTNPTYVGGNSNILIET